MDPIFEAPCNCLFNTSNLATGELESLGKSLGAIGVYVDKGIFVDNVRRFGNWVGGRVYVFEDRVVFSTNGLNALFQIDSSDLVVPTAMIRGVGLGKMFGFAKTVDCELVNAKLRFRCAGKSNDRLMDAIRSVTGQA
ncbi:MAG: hypothetical protein AAF376_15535 [Pseudomonadota bacterium]